MTSFFFNASGSLDQIGGSIDLPAKINYIPFIQGITTSIPIGLFVSQGRKFIWQLEQNYPGVSLNNVTNEQVNLLFDLNTYREFSIRLRVSIQGQPRRFAVYEISTTLQSILSNGNLGSNGLKINNIDYQINDLSVGLDHSLINEAGTLNNVSSGLIFSWNKPISIENFEDYILEEYVSGSGWSEWSVQTTRVKSVINTNNGYRIQAQYDKYKKGDYVYFPLRNNSQIYAKSIAKLIGSKSNHPTIATTNINTDSFFSFTNQNDYEDSFYFINQGTTKVKTEVNITDYAQNFWSLNTQQDYESMLTNYSLRATNIGSPIGSTPAYTEIFWTTSIGV